MQHPVEDLGRALRIRGLLAGADQGAVGNCRPEFLGLSALSPKNYLCHFGRAVGNDVWHEAIMLHPVEDLGGELRIPSLLAGADQGSGGDDVWPEALRRHPVEDFKRTLRTLGQPAGDY